LASGINPKQSIIFQQSTIKEHTELAWILNCASARMSDLAKMTQFKDKASGKHDSNVSVGLFDYPVLMASDILLYDTDAVPVGEDQKQHVELARDLAKRFNHDFGETFKIPEVIIRKEGARIMGLDNPKNKMSKSASPANYIALTDSHEVATKKIMRAVTDNGTDIIYDKDQKPAIANLLTIYSLLAKEPIKRIEQKYAGLGYGDFKRGLAEQVCLFLTDFQKKFETISDKEVKAIISAGAESIRPMAVATVNRAKKQLGIN
jgi:tryptophanyl-tRNA synthetase